MQRSRGRFDPSTRQHDAHRFIWLACVVVTALPSLTQSNSGPPSVEILSPQQWSSVSNVLKIEWAVRDFPELHASQHQIIIIINGLVAHTSRSPQDAVLLNQLTPGSYYIQAMLAKHDDVEGMDDVLATAMVECFFGVEAPPARPVTKVNGEFTPYVSAAQLPAKEEARKKVVIFAFHCNRPDFVRLQAKALKHFILDDFTLVIVNDAPSDEIRDEIAAAAEEVGAENIQTPDYFDHSDPSEVVGRIVTWAVQDVALKRFDNSLLFLLEGDMFPVAPFSVSSFMDGWDIAGTQQGRRHRSSGFLLRYLWVGLLMVQLEGLAHKQLLRFERQVIGDVGGDTAAALHHFFDANPNVPSEARVRRVLHTSHIHAEFSNRDALPAPALERYQDPFRMELYERTFLHYGSASNWKVGRHFEYFNSGQDFLPSKTAFLRWFVAATIDGAVQVPDFDFVFEEGTWTLPTGPAAPAADDGSVADTHDEL